MTPDLMNDGANETYKGGAHLAMFALASAFTAYNLGALIARPTRQLAINTLVYAGLMALEARQVHTHWARPAQLEGRQR